jgi:hypothetical protein
MARGLFITGFTISEVLAIQSRAKEFLIEGKTLMTWNEAGSAATKQFTMPIDQVLEECAHALRILDPATYGKAHTIAVSQVSGYLPK